MKEIVYSTARQNLKAVMDEVVDSKQPVKITRRDHAEPVIVLGEKQYERLTLTGKKKRGEK